MVIVILSVIGVMGGGVMLIMGGKGNPAIRKAKKNQRYLRIYKKLAGFTWTEKTIRTIHSRLAKLSIYKQEELCLLTVQYFLFSWGCSFIVILGGVILFGDILSIMLCFILAMVLNNVIIDKTIDKEYRQVLEELVQVLSGLREGYLLTNSVVEALQNLECPSKLKKNVEEVLSILTAADSDLRLQEFYAATPFRALQTLVGVCYNINNQGDTKRVDGNSNFVSALLTMTEDTNTEIEKLELQKSLFKSIEWLPFAPILAIPLIESYFTKIMPGTAMIYGGPLGYMFKILILTSIVVAFKFTTGVNQVTPIKGNDQSGWVLKCLKHKGFKQLIKDIVPKNKKRSKFKLNLRLAQSKQSVEEIYTRKLVYGILGLISALMVCIATVHIGGEYVRNSTKELSLVGTGVMEKFSEDSILALDQKYFELRDAVQSSGAPEEGEKYVKLNEDAVKGLIQGYMPGLSELQTLDQVKRLDDKYVLVKNTKFHWWMLWLGFTCGVICWNIPNMQLRTRRLLIRTEMEDDFLQLQTLVTILMTTNIDTMELLYEMYQQSRVHKDILLYCYHAYPSNPMLELSRLQSKLVLPEFRRFVGSLKQTVSDISLQEAFSDLELQRNHIMIMRKRQIEKTIQSKRVLCGMLCMLPLGLLVLGEFIVPIGYLGFMEFSKVLNMMNM